ncbi:MAG: glycosyltransferase family 2 protein [Methylophagaceae bacterium]
MKASVIIPTKNAGYQFKNVLEMVLDQDAPWEYEVLVIDSGSSDGTVAFVESKHNVHLHQITAKDFGHGKTRNLGISLSRGEFIIMITHDALPAIKTWLVEIVAAVEQSEDVAGAFGRHVAYEHDGPFLARDLNAHFDGFLVWPSVMRCDDKARYANDRGYRQLLHFFSDNNACLRRSVWEKIPYPEVDFAEDQLWAKQIIEAGYAKAYADKALVFHSHTFNFIELFQRSFDESMALEQLFGYKLGPTINHMLKQSVATIINDVMYLIREKKLRTEFIWLIRIPFRNISKQLGYYLGQRNKSLPYWLLRRLSRDISLQQR